MNKILSAIGVGVVALLALTACGTAAAETPASTAAAVEAGNLDALVAAAKKEGTLRIYGQIPEASMTALSNDFQKKYGITVEALRLGGNTLAQRFDTETQAHTPSADMIVVVDVQYLATAAKAGSVVAYSKSGVADLLDLPKEAVFSDYDAPSVQVLDTGFIYNTDKVRKSEIPTTWSALEDPSWKGRYCAVDPGTSVNVAHSFWSVGQKEGADALKKLGENIGRWYPNVIAMNEAVAVGECQLGLFSAKFFVAGMQGNGAKVEFATAPSSVPPLVSAAVAAKAEHPNAARLFMEYLLSKEGNAVLNNPDTGSIGPWDMARLPAGFSAPTPDDFQRVHEATPDVIKALGL
ncbi:ABC transporter substrate-binding protein [Sinomonas sp. R1AF57]|uniref:ABC transporter substrate-binding protein n=1 Tax=Sinomonas sp. R1AF57 TaxID=2020377 RepID=UPI000B5EF59C|nr:ABC transporter substrate-binding protein [Sinomonas sp. R1AF57]ASN53360.1 hypothetical protein CGQ25_15690 [Sinomonas sp. R1AF57]